MVGILFSFWDSAHFQVRAVSSREGSGVKGEKVDDRWVPFGKLRLMAEILHQLRLVVYPIVYRVLYIPGG